MWCDNDPLSCCRALKHQQAIRSVSIHYLLCIYVKGKSVAWDMPNYHDVILFRFCKGFLITSILNGYSEGLVFVYLRRTLIHSFAHNEDESNIVWFNIGNETRFNISWKANDIPNCCLIRQWQYEAFVSNPCF